MFQPPAAASSAFKRTFWSLSLHVGVLLLLLHGGKRLRVRPSLPGTALGSRVELTYLPGKVAAPVQLKQRQAAPSAIKSRLKAPPQPALVSAPLEAVVTDTASSSPSGATGNDALGNDNIRIALTTYSPSPRPDLSHLPHGLQGDVVLDVTIDPTGKVADLQILHQLGYGIDGPVADAVRSWKFTPATKDGVPVASVQELHFHYGPV